MGKREPKQVILAMMLITAGMLAVSLFQENESGIRMVTGAATGTATVVIQAAVEISLPVDAVNFGNMTTGESKNTTTNNPLPFLLRNDGTVLVNVSIARDNSSAALFSGTGGGDNSTSFRFKPAVAGEGVSADPSCSKINWTNVPGANPLDFLCKFNFVDTNDEAEVELMANVPVDEPSGSKSESLVFIATEA